MTDRRGLAVALGVTVLGLVLVSGIARWYRRPPAAGAAPAAAASAASATGRRIKVRLFYVADDGLRLTSVEREVPYGETPVAQARAIVDAQIAAVSDPLVSAVPAGTKVRALFLTAAGQAYVDLSREIVDGHPGGAAAEILTVYTIVEALTVNLPAVTSVQLLIEGKEVDTLAGHVDLRRPLVNNAAWIQ